MASRLLPCLLFVSLLVLSCAARGLREETDAHVWEDTPSLGQRLNCGTVGKACCVTVAEDESRTVSASCADDTLYCQSFPSQPLTDGSDSAADNASVALLAYTGPPSLCLPKPTACGGAGQPCCPLTGNQTDASLRCSAEHSLCVADPAFSANLTGLLTLADFQRLQKDPSAQLDEAAQRSVWGSCQAFDPETCGKPEGLCGPRLPAPAAQCPEEVQGCGEGHYCELQEGQLQEWGLCKAVPEAAGTLGNKCLPPGNYSDGTVALTPFCNDTAHLSKFDIYCHAPEGDVAASECRRLPVSPRDCGATGGECCPSSYHVVTDRPLPPVCEEGSYCASPSAGAAPVCVANPPGAGAPGQQCLASSAKGGTAFSCDEGSYCDRGLEAHDLGLLPSQLSCKRCGSAVDVPLAYHSVCGIGLGPDATAAGEAATVAPIEPVGVADGATNSGKPSGVEVETQSCEHCMRLRRLLRALSF